MSGFIRSFVSRYFRKMGENGAIGINFALALTPLMAAGGIALDFNLLAAKRARLQDALDSATLASTATTAGFSQTEAQKYFTANAAAENITINSLTFTQGTGTTVGTLVATVPTSFMTILGVYESKLKLKSVAGGASRTVITNATAKIASVKGEYDKQIYFYSRNGSGAIVDERLVLSYDYSRVLTITTPRGTASALVSNINAPYYGIKMVIYRDNTRNGLKTNPLTIYYDPITPSRSVLKTGDCATTAGETQRWEDGGDGDYLDFVFNVKCTRSTQTDPNGVRLVQ